MTKVPRAGNVKTRLSPILSPEQREALAGAFLADAMAKTENRCGKLIVAFTPTSEKDYFARFDCEDLTLIEQTGVNLGDRMRNAFEFAFQANSDASVVMIGTDSPTFPDRFIEDAFARLETEAETVLGKAADGGFYLIGLRSNFENLLENVEWSSPRVYEQISRNIENLRINLQTIPAWYDIDEPADLKRLKVEMAGDERMRLTAPHTVRWMLANQKIFGGEA